MEAGRDLDALVAEKVMGLVPCDQWHWEYGGWGMAMTGKDVYISSCGHNDCYPATDPPHYSTDIVAAWPIWKLMRAAPQAKLVVFLAALRTLVSLRIGKDYRITDFETTLNMEPEDVCKAALEAHGQRMMPDWYYS